MDSFLELKIVEHPLVPSRESNYRLAPGDYIGGDYRRFLQAWCDEFFGTHAVVYVFNPSACGLFRGPMLATSPENMAMIRAAFP